MNYYRIIINDPGDGDGYMEVANGYVQRITDLSGATITPTSYSTTGEIEFPAWGLPDPEPEAPPVSPVPDVVTKRQFLIQLLRAGMVAPEEVATLALQPPALMSAVLDAMSEADELEARLSWGAMTQVERYSPLTLAAAAAAGTTEEQLDDFFRAAVLI
jgi:hypothetical protein